MCSPKRSKINAVIILVATSEGSRQLETFRRSCRDNTKMVLKVYDYILITNFCALIIICS